ncbi:hypothetical protein AVEN_170921-1 [Araneus ventricosus]|uniref:Uncharacterized protein n=1 Tax=Araneus ventricosus TaxID=182803 RepID=A0A4Y2JFF5_ARAVE|nr:hypothetical protein AVEN_170921-1 [Araneus ventricosus]
MAAISFECSAYSGTAPNDAERTMVSPLYTAALPQPRSGSLSFRHPLASPAPYEIFDVTKGGENLFVGSLIFTPILRLAWVATPAAFGKIHARNKVIVTEWRHAQKRMMF